MDTPENPGDAEQPETPEGGQAPPPIDLEQLPPHIRTPHVRPFQPLGVQRDGKQFVALRDPSQLQKQTMVIPVPAMQAVQQFQGRQTIDEIATRFGGDPRPLVELAGALDKMGLLWGPTFEAMEQARLRHLQQHGAYPVRFTKGLGETAEACRAQLQSWLDETEDPELEFTPRAIVAPHLDYDRGWPNYAAAYRALMPDVEHPPAKPDRVLILGTNHFGLGDGVVLTEFGFESPLGRLEIDRPVLDALVERLGKGAMVDQLDHAPEHSIELHVPWIQHVFGDVPVVAALVPDPLRPMIEDDGDRVTMDDFVPALRAVLEEVGGTTFVVSSSDLSHVGPQFGEPRPVDRQRCIDVETHDREMMGKFLAGDADEFLGAMKWSKNPTRWCSIGSMAATLQVVEPGELELVDYRQARDEQGAVMVSSAAMALG